MRVRKASGGISVAARYFVEWLEGKRSLYLGFSAEVGINSNLGVVISDLSNFFVVSMVTEKVAHNIR